MHFKKLSLGILFLLIAFYRAEALPSLINAGKGEVEDIIVRVLGLNELKAALIKDKPFTYEYVLYGHIKPHNISYSYSTPRFFIVVKQIQDDEEERSFIASYNRSTIQADHGLQQQWTGLSFARLKNEIKKTFPAEEKFSELNNFECSFSEMNSNLKRCLWKDVVARNLDHAVNAYIYNSQRSRAQANRKEAILNYYDKDTVTKEEKTLVESTVSDFRKVSLLEFLPKELQEKYSKVYFITWSSDLEVYVRVSKLILVQEKDSDTWKGVKYKDLDLASVLKDSSRDAKKAYEICEERLKANENFNDRSLRNLVAHHWFSKLSHLPPPSDDLTPYEEAVGEFCNESSQIQ